MIMRMNDINREEIHKYLELPYTIMIQERNDDGHYYFGRVLELEGCMSHGETIEELQANILEAMECYIESCLRDKEPVPVPVTESKYSGKFNIRIPKSLHERLAIEAKREGVSLNQYALYKLAL